MITVKQSQQLWFIIIIIIITIIILIADITNDFVFLLSLLILWMLVIITTFNIVAAGVITTVLTRQHLKTECIWIMYTLTKQHVEAATDHSNCALLQAVHKTSAKGRYLLYPVHSKHPRS